VSRWNTAQNLLKIRRAARPWTTGSGRPPLFAPAARSYLRPDAAVPCWSSTLRRSRRRFQEERQPCAIFGVSLRICESAVIFTQRFLARMSLIVIVPLVASIRDGAAMLRNVPRSLFRVSSLPSRCDRPRAHLVADFDLVERAFLRVGKFHRCGA